MDRRDILIRQVDNAGVLIRLGDTWICTDILCAHGYGKYMTADEAAIEELYQAGPKEWPEACLITHEHPDHFSEERMRRYARIHKEMKIISNEAVVSRLRPCIEEERLTSIGRGMKQKIMAGKTLITAFSSRHMGRQYDTIVNLSFLLEYRGYRILITGDADPRYLLRQAAELGMKADLLISPFAYITLRFARRQLEEVLGARQVFAIHLPAGGKDGTRFREILNAAQKEEGIPQIIYGNELGQELVIKIV